jgi:hypothetical protein
MLKEAIEKQSPEYFVDLFFHEHREAQSGHLLHRLMQ